MTGNPASHKQCGSIDRQRKADTFRLTGNHTFWVLRVPVTDKERCKGGNLVSPKVTFAACALTTVKLALQIRSTHHALLP